MKYEQRQAELPYLKAMYDTYGIPYIEYPGVEPFEGQAELKWFHGGTKALCGYGYRSTQKTFEELDRFFKELYGKESPELLVVPLNSFDYYHLDAAMLEYADSKCIVHKRAFSTASMNKIMKFLGKENVTVIDTTDSFCLNAVIDGPNLLTHTLTDPSLKPLFERLTGCSVVQIDTSDFERSGGSVRCMTLDLF
jgi:N-dimethylarginine dimethylaminohydrolase